MPLAVTPKSASIFLTGALLDAKATNSPGVVLHVAFEGVRVELEVAPRGNLLVREADTATETTAERKPQQTTPQERVCGPSAEDKIERDSDKVNEKGTPT